MRLIRSGEFPRMRWKNGGGETVELAIWPRSATLDNFDWRISTARVESDGPFSTFREVDRSLVVLRGHGMALTIGSKTAIEMTSLSPPLSFDAAAATSARLVDGPVVDLNVMTRRGRFSHRMRRIASRENAVVESSAIHTHLLAWDGDIAVETPDGRFSLEAGDVLHACDASTRWLLSLGPGALAYLVEIVKSAATER